MYRIDIVKNGHRWKDTVGVSSTSDNIATVAVSLLADAATEVEPQAGLRCVAEVFDAADRLVLKAELTLSD